MTDIDFKDFMNPYKKCSEKACSFVVTDTTLTSNVLTMTIDHKIRDERLQYDITRELGKASEKQ